MSSDNLFDQIYNRIGEKSTKKLLTIWEQNDRGLWSDQAFKVMEEILVKRGEHLPVQGQIKKSGSGNHSFLESWENPYISWAFYLLFLFWIVALHPFFLIGGHFTLSIQNPLHPDLTQSLNSMIQSTDRNAYKFLLKIFSFLEIFLVCLGYYAGYLLVEKKLYALAWTRLYISLLFSWLICTFLVYNFYPFVEAILQTKASVIGLPLNWEILFKKKFSKRSSEYAWISLKIYMTPIVCTIVWFIYFSKSKWIAKRIQTALESSRKF